MKRTRGRGRTAVALALVLAVLGMLAAKCPGDKVAVRAVARGVMSAAPFFVRLGTDIAIGVAMDYIAGEMGGGAPGLYGGTRDAGRCDKAKLVEFLGKPENRGKAQEWAEVAGLDDVGQIKGYVKKLTPVLLRADTLVRNHDFKKGRAKAFDALLEAGIAVLVDQLGRPAVQCSCGNPLASFEDDIDAADVEFDDRNRKWPSYDSKKVAKVKAAPEEDRVEVFQLVDLENPDSGLARDAGSDGTEDEILPVAPTPTGPSVTPTDSPTPTPTPSAETVAVPDVRGQPLADAQLALEAQGFQVTTTEEVTGTAAPGTVVAQSPEAGTEAPADSLVMLTVESGGTVTPDPTGDIGGGDGGGESGGTGEDGADAGAVDSGGLFGGTAYGG
ncbi:DUF6777 domain-containing protein [Streptomyces sp. NPDC050535]|uniref:DUF6777 domain-containing protein n=1 Tax=Streptomyces sp. NPDC050535 TaxID=3365626 RepID=UPI0037AB38DD